MQSQAEVVIDIPECDPLFDRQWSSIPVECELALAEDSFESSRNSFVQPKKCNLIVPRQSFLFLHVDGVLSQLDIAAASRGRVWFSVRVGSWIFPLPWQYPVSVLCDMISQFTLNQTNIYPLRLCVNLLPEGREREKEKDRDKESASPTSFRESLKDQQRELQKELVAKMLFLDVRQGMLYYRHLLKQSMANMSRGDASPFRVMEQKHGRLHALLLSGAANNDPVAFWQGRCAAIAVCETAVSEQQVTLQFPIVLHRIYCGEGIKPPTFHSTTVMWNRNGSRLWQFLRFHLSDIEVAREDHNREIRGITVQGIHPLMNTPMEFLVDVLASSDLRDRKSVV